MERQIFTKVENITTQFQSYQVFSFPQEQEVITSEELLNRIKEHYQFHSKTERIRLELWSGPLGSKRVRLDTLKEIPREYNTIWIRGFLLTEY